MVLGNFQCWGVGGCPTYLDNSRARAYCACNTECEWGMFRHKSNFNVSNTFGTMKTCSRQG